MTAFLLASSLLAWRGIPRARFSQWNAEHNVRFVSDKREGTHALKVSTPGVSGAFWGSLETAF